MQRDLGTHEMFGLILVCSSLVPMGQCWPGRADAMFVASEDDMEQPAQAIARRRIDLRNRYVVVRDISCASNALEISKSGAQELPPGCRDMGSATGHCMSPLCKGRCPD